MKVVAYFPLFGKCNKRTLQHRSVDEFSKNFDHKVIAQFEEREPGLSELRCAVLKATKSKATLVFSRLGYLSKNLKFLRVLAEGGSELQFIALDDDHFNAAAFSIYLAQAREVWRERRNRIKDAMAEAKSNGAKFGMARRGAKTKKWRAAEGWRQAAEASVIARTERVTDAYALLIPKMFEMKKKGEGPTAIALALNEEGHVTTTGAPFSAPTVFRIMKRHERQGGRNDRASGKGLGRPRNDAAANGSAVDENHRRGRSSKARQKA